MPYSHETARLSTLAASRFGIGDVEFSARAAPAAVEMHGKIRGKAWFRLGQRAACGPLKWPVSPYRPALPEGIHAAIVPPLSGQVNWGVAKW
ncbi:hypothetical protein [Bradyrhizobium sp.]|uniref:hypothetical protein n=1 Tax=Bradyrhizobium sp. TaxID=376 RepID=UPI002DFB22E8|nr:hypothetical protein [Bradyrhizobium sp.]